jgi:hypothetical protein
MRKNQSFFYHGENNELCGPGFIVFSSATSIYCWFKLSDDTFFKIGD